eukprot:TRINITY_DN4384_c0_g2_i2.p1 TRINITY_DN4384_c0_g2~~TRINITY_DN4384_c0_g2_i2.p1  ORF type:complete len:300 (+),score=65.39 TRINITY_DN4384_c0_g2_i2:71-970(+)
MVPVSVRLALVLLLALSVVDAEKKRGKKENTADPGAPQKNLYEIIGVRKHAPSSEIRKAYRAAALKSHPDHVQDAAEREAATANFVKIQHAFEVLSNDLKRARYDYILSEYGELDYDDSDDYYDVDEALGFIVGRSKEEIEMDEAEAAENARLAAELAESEERVLIILTILTVLGCIGGGVYHWHNKRQRALAEKQKYKKLSQNLKKTAEMTEREKQKILESSESTDADADADDADESEPKSEAGGSANAPTFLCKLCNKKYKTNAQLWNHYESKAHIKAQKEADYAKEKEKSQSKKNR